MRVNCAAIPRDLVESEMFGHERGAFTGATERRIGRFELAHTGTLFLDEVGDLHAEAQAKLLRAIEAREIERVGGGKPIKIDVRILAATNKDLARAVADGTFREDLFFRLNVIPIALPPLRDRPGDLPALVRHFADRHRTRTGQPLVRWTDSSAHGVRRVSLAGQRARTGQHRRTAGHPARRQRDRGPRGARGAAVGRVRRTNRRGHGGRSSRRHPTCRSAMRSMPTSGA